MAAESTPRSRPVELSWRKKVSPTSKERPRSVSIWDWELEHFCLGFRGFRIGGLNARDNMAGGLLRFGFGQFMWLEN